MTAHALLMAKAPVPGEAKTRLGAEVGMVAAAALATAALADTIEACTTAFGAQRCRLALAGDLDRVAEGVELRAQLTGWTVYPQRGEGFAARLSHAHADSAGRAVVQIGMDTPQVTPALLVDVAGGLDRADAVLGPADDGGWWVLALRDPAHAAVLSEVEMSTPSTYADTLAALEGLGIRVVGAPTLRDVDTAADADLVADLAPDTRFARAWKGLR